MVEVLVVFDNSKKYIRSWNENTTISNIYQDVKNMYNGLHMPDDYYLEFNGNELNETHLKKYFGTTSQLSPPVPITLNIRSRTLTYDEQATDDSCEHFEKYNQDTSAVQDLLGHEKQSPVSEEPDKYVKLIFQRLLEKNTSDLSLEELCRDVDVTMIGKDRQALYTRIWEVFIENLVQKDKLNVDNSFNKNFMTIFNAFWNIDSTAMQMITSEPMCLDQAYISEQNLQSVHNLDVISFRQHIVQNSIIQGYLKRIVNQMDLKRLDNRHDLRIFYQIGLYIPEIKSQINQIVSKSVLSDNFEAINQTCCTMYYKKISKAYIKYKKLIKETFDDDKDILETFHLAYSDIVNMGTNAPNFLAKYCDIVLQKRVARAASVAKQIVRIKIIFDHLNNGNKNIFKNLYLEYFKKHFCTKKVVSLINQWKGIQQFFAPSGLECISSSGMKNLSRSSREIAFLLCLDMYSRLISYFTGSEFHSWRDKIEKFLEQKVTEVQQCIVLTDRERVLDLFVSLWEKNDQICLDLEYGTRLLMRRWNEQRAKQMTRNGRIKIFYLAKRIWRECFFAKVFLPAMNSCLDLIYEKFNRSSNRTRIIQAFVFKLYDDEHFEKDMSRFLMNESIKLSCKKYFEEKLIQKSPDYYSKYENLPINSRSISECYEIALEYRDDEINHVKCYLTSAALQILMEKFEHWLYSDVHQLAILEKIRTFQFIDDNEELEIIFRFLRNIEIKSKFLKNVEEMIDQMSFEKIKNTDLSRGEYAIVCINIICEIHNMLTKLKKIKPPADSSLIAIFDKKLNKLIDVLNVNHHRPKLCELLAQYSDEILHEGSQVDIHINLEEKTDRIINIFRWLKNKKIFKNTYERLLAYRLNNKTAVLADEEIMVLKLRQASNSQYTSKIDAMMQKAHVEFSILDYKTNYVEHFITHNGN